MNFHVKFHVGFEAEGGVWADLSFQFCGLFVLSSVFSNSKRFPEYDRCVLHSFTILFVLELGLLMTTTL